MQVTCLIPEERTEGGDGEGIREAEQILSRNTDKATPGTCRTLKTETTQKQPERKVGERTSEAEA